MDREHILDEYIKDDEEAKKKTEKADEYLDKMEMRLKGTKTLLQVKLEADKFLSKYDVTPEVREEILKICNNFDKKTDATKARIKLLEYIEKYKADKEKESEETEETVEEIKEDFMEKVEKKLDEHGIDMVGDTKEAIENIEDEHDIRKIEEQLKQLDEELTEYLDDSRNIRSEIDIEEVVKDTKDSPLTNNTIFLDEAVNNMDLYSIGPTDMVKTSEDGNVLLESSSMNLASMMTLMLATNNNELSMNTNLNMKFMKSLNPSRFTMEFGSFKPGAEEISPLLVEKINEKVATYDKDVDYNGLLKQSNPSLGTVFEIIDENIMNKPGDFKMAVKNDGNTHNMRIGFSDEYEAVKNEFSQNGAIMTNDGAMTTVSIENIEDLNNQLLLTNVDEGLKAMSKPEDITNIEDAKPKEMVKTDDRVTNLNSVANVDTTFLRTVAVANILMIIALIAILLLK